MRHSRYAGESRGVRILATSFIDRPVGDVFAAMLDLENAELFDPDVRSATKTTAGPIGVGTVFEFDERTPPFGRYQKNSVRYTAIEPDTRVGWIAQIGRLAPRGSLLFESVGNGTRLSFRDEGQPTGWLRLLSPILARQGRKIWAQRFADFKSWIESRPRNEHLAGDA